MGCVIANITTQRIDAPVVVTSSRIGEQTIVSSERVDDMIVVTSKRMGIEIAVTAEHIGALPSVTSSINCDVGVGEFARWALESLQWLGEDNQVGVTKYNKLIASGEWSLEELEIEELL